MFAGDDVGVSTVFGLTSNGYTVVVLANIDSVAQPVAERIRKIIGS